LAYSELNTICEIICVIGVCASNENANLIKGLKGIDFLLVANFPLKKWKQKLSEHTFIQLLLEIEEKSMKPHIPSLNKIFEV
jgi:hypothetical protein